MSTMDWRECQSRGFIHKNTRHTTCSHACVVSMVTILTSLPKAEHKLQLERTGLVFHKIVMVIYIGVLHRIKRARVLMNIAGNREALGELAPRVLAPLSTDCSCHRLRRTTSLDVSTQVGTRRRVDCLLRVQTSRDLVDTDVSSNSQYLGES